MFGGSGVGRVCLPNRVPGAADRVPHLENYCSEVWLILKGQGRVVHLNEGSSDDPKTFSQDGRILSSESLMF